MGNSAVAVIHYDHTDQIAKIAPRMATAMIDHAAGRDIESSDFGFGRIVSWDHADGYQVCVIHGNTGWRIDRDSELPVDVEIAVARMLVDRGWKCSPPKDR